MATSPRRARPIPNHPTSPDPRIPNHRPIPSRSNPNLPSPNHRRASPSHHPNRLHASLRRASLRHRQRLRGLHQQPSRNVRRLKPQHVCRRLRRMNGTAHPRLCCRGLRPQRFHRGYRRTSHDRRLRRKLHGPCLPNHRACRRYNRESPHNHASPRLRGRHCSRRATLRRNSHRGSHHRRRRHDHRLHHLRGLLHRRRRVEQNRPPESTSRRPKRYLQVKRSSRWIS
jgi:hypothetical protein